MVKVVVFLAAAAGALNFGSKPTTAGTTPAAFKPAFGNPAAVAQTGTSSSRPLSLRTHRKREENTRLWSGLSRAAAATGSLQPGVQPALRGA